MAEHDRGYDLQAVISWLRATVRVPVVLNLPYGHVPLKATLPVGKKIGIATEDDMAYVVIEEHH